MNVIWASFVFINPLGLCKNIEICKFLFYKL